MKTEAEIWAIVERILYPDHWFVLIPKGDGYLLQLRYLEPDVDTGKVEEQHARKWYVSPHATESEIVRTAFAACMMSAEHRVREHFHYKGKRVFGPHLEVAHLLGITNYAPDRRDPPSNTHTPTAEDWAKLGLRAESCAGEDDDYG